MKKFKFLSVVLAIAIVLTMPTFAGAKSFSDVNSSTHSWAIEAIENMADLGIITGYSDGTFKPDNTVTKLEALLLTARILGVNSPENEAFLEAAKTMYGEKVDKFELTFGSDEVCYLLMKNIIKEDELGDYIDKTNANSGMKRYEIAVLLTKALDAESEVSKNLITTLEFDDADDIPAYAKKYVEYVTKNGMMNGVGDNKFSPATDVTRAQAALLMNKLREATLYTYYSGQVADIDYASKVIKVKNETDSYRYIINTGVTLRFEGADITLNDIVTGYNAVLTVKDGSLYAIDFITPLVDKEVTGVVSSKTAGNKASISIYVVEEDDVTIGTDVKETYPLSSDVAISYEDEGATLNDIPVGAFVHLSIKKGEAATIRGYAKTKNVSGRVIDVTITPLCMISVELTDGTQKTYILDSNVEVSKNGAKSTATAIVSGDTVALTLTYDRVTKIVSTSKKQSKAGVIQEVIISASPKITVKTDDGTMTYPISNACEIVMPGKSTPTFYDLRVGVAVSMTMEGETVVKLETDVSEGVTQISGTVSSVNTSYSVIQVTYTDKTSGITVTEPVFVKSKATIIDILTGSSIKLSAVKEGAVITAFGMRNSGVFEATTINVSNN